MDRDSELYTFCILENHPHDNVFFFFFFFVQLTGGLQQNYDTTALMLDAH